MVTTDFRKMLLFFGVLLWHIAGVSQNGFFLPANNTYDKIPFKLVNNLVVVPVTINGTELSFLLDTGVRTTILFGLAQTDTVEMKNVKPIKIRGLGEGGSVEALKSEKNTFRIGKAIDINHTVYVVFDESLNFSPRMGIPIHGILGYDFFRQFVVKTNYNARRLTFYNPNDYNATRCRTCEEFDLFFFAEKPHVTLSVTALGKKRDVTLMVDSGSSDALWLFDDSTFVRAEPINYFEDFLGLGLSGNIYGKRSRIDELHIGKHTLFGVSVASPNKEALENSVMHEDRSGSLGGNILKRFTVIMDFPGKKMTLKKNGNFKEPFYYNMSGLTIEHDGVEVVEDQKKVLNNPLTFNENDMNKNAFGIIKTSQYRFVLAPRIIVAEIRKGSPAEEAGILKGDEIKFINGKPAHQFELYEITDIFSSKVGRRISMDILRDGKTIKKKFILRKLI